ncbi:MAG: hypothetical protein V3U96_03780 [Paracoccaceae bacterium]
MTKFTYPNFPTGHGYMTQSTMRAYITTAIEREILPPDAARMADIISLDAPNDPDQPIQFWQLFSVLGQDRIMAITTDFYTRVFADENWFTSVFARVGPMQHHINTQTMMWLDVMGAGAAYHGAEFRLNFHHTHNAMALMNARGARRWSKLMLATLDARADQMTDDARVRVAINTFLNHFMGKYEAEFNFTSDSTFGPLNPPVMRKINLRTMTEDAIAALSEADLRAALGVEAGNADKAALVRRALAV